MLTRHDSALSQHLTLCCSFRNQAEEGEAEEKEGFGGEEEHPAAIQDLHQPAAQRGTQEGRLQRSLQVPQR